MPFLKSVANDILDTLSSRTGTSLRDVTIVFPNKRASLFFNQHLLERLAPPIWLPTYTTITELFQSMSRLTVADPVLLVYYLYKAYIEVTHKSESFDHFYSWGEVLLNDFDDIDSHMVDAQKLFVNTHDLERLVNYDYLDEAEQEAIRKLFQNFNIESATQLHQRYLEMWSVMPHIYTTFRQMLRNRGLAYEGMMKRDVIENLLSGAQSASSPSSPTTIYAFVGFNFLNTTEKSLFKYLATEHEAWFYWDYDHTYKDGLGGQSSASTFEAGQFISENIKLFGNKLADATELHTRISQPKTIRIISAPTDNAQCRYVGDWIKDNIDPSQPLNRNAVVLCDEHLLLPVLHSIPGELPSIHDGNQRLLPLSLNITMGFPMQDTPVASFVIALAELYFRGWCKPTEKHPEGRWRYTYAERAMKHPYTLLMNKEGVVRLLADFRKTNNTYPSTNSFAQVDFLCDIFRAPGSMTDVMRHISTLLQTVAMKFSPQPSDKQSSEKQPSDNSMSQQSFAPLYAESLYGAWTIINRFTSLMESDGLQFASADTLIRLLRQALGSKTIAFHGEPAVGLQVMGILETRNLDFDNLIMLSVGEGILPKASRTSTFIFNFLREAHGMTTPSRKVSLNAYYFYRLLQQARNITFVFNESSEGLSRGEMSRFLMQLKYEGRDFLSPETTITEQTLIASQNREAKEPTLPSSDLLTVPKSSPQVVTALNAIHRLSPTALNTYINCPLQFYLHYVCHFDEQEDVSEDVADNVFGSIFHKAMELFYADSIGRELHHTDYSRYVAEDEDGHPYITADGKHHIRRLVDQAFLTEMFHQEEANVQTKQPQTTNHKPQTTSQPLELNGTGLLNHEVIARYVEKQVKNDYSLCPLTIVATEQVLYNDIHFNCEGRRRTIEIGGTIDREDIATIDGIPVHRIVDYKTSTAEQQTKSIEDLFIHSPRRAGYILQTLYYCEVRTKEAEKLGQHLPPLSPALLYIKHNKPANDSIVKIDKQPIEDYQRQHRQEFTERLQDLLTEIFRTDNTFQQSTDDTHCLFCPFTHICGTRK